MKLLTHDVALQRPLPVGIRPYPDLPSKADTGCCLTILAGDNMMTALGMCALQGLRQWKGRFIGIVNQYGGGARGGENLSLGDSEGKYVSRMCWKTSAGNKKGKEAKSGPPSIVWDVRYCFDCRCQFGFHFERWGNAP